jgi:hypothetical protein
MKRHETKKEGKRSKKKGIERLLWKKVKGWWLSLSWHLLKVWMACV